MSASAWNPDWTTPAGVTIHCLGCHDDYDGLAAYHRHDCPEPHSGEAFK